MRSFDKGKSLVGNSSPVGICILLILLRIACNETRKGLSSFFKYIYLFLHNLSVAVMPVFFIMNPAAELKIFLFVPVRVLSVKCGRTYWNPVYWHHMTLSSFSGDFLLECLVVLFYTRSNRSERHILFCESWVIRFSEWCSTTANIALHDDTKKIK